MIHYRSAQLMDQAQQNINGKEKITGQVSSVCILMNGNSIPKRLERQSMIKDKQSTCETHLSVQFWWSKPSRKRTFFFLSSKTRNSSISSASCASNATLSFCFVVGDIWVWCAYMSALRDSITSRKFSIPCLCSFSFCIVARRAERLNFPEHVGVAIEAYSPFTKYTLITNLHLPKTLQLLPGIRRLSIWN